MMLFSYFIAASAFFISSSKLNVTFAGFGNGFVSNEYNSFDGIGGGGGTSDCECLFATSVGDTLTSLVISGSILDKG